MVRAWAATLIVVTHGLLTSRTTIARTTESPFCAETVETAVVAALRARRFLDVHTVATAALALCPRFPASVRLQTYDAIALMELDESARAREALQPVTESNEAPARDNARVLHTWSYLRDGDDRAFTLSLETLQPGARVRLMTLALASDRHAFTSVAASLDPAIRSAVGDTARAIWEAERTKRPWLAGTLSAVLPGAGQLYAGSAQGAAVAFVLNAVLIGATAELAWHKLYLTSAAAAVTSSFFYVGNVINAVDLARRRNETAAAPARLDLERQLLPEAHP
jgi:hypothetical protein